MKQQQHLGSSSSSSVSSLKYLHPSIQLCRSEKHGYGISVYKFGPKIETGEILIQEAPMVTFPLMMNSDDDVPVVTSPRLNSNRFSEELLIETSSSASSSFISAFTTLAPYQDHYETASDIDDIDVGDESDETTIANFSNFSSFSATKKKEVFRKIIESNMMKMKNVDFSISSETATSSNDNTKEYDEDGDDVHIRVKRAIFFLSSRFNHSCSPNATQVFPEKDNARSSSNEEPEKNPVVTIVALRDILPGEEICISYANPLDSRKHKKERMEFSCKTDDEEDEEENCQVCSLVDPKQQHIEKKKVVTTEDELFHLLSKASEFIEKSKPITALRYLLGYLQTPQFKNLPPYHFIRFQLYQEILAAGVDAISTQKDVDDLIENVAKPLVEKAKKVLPENWPLISGFQVHLAYLLALRTRILRMNSENDQTEDGEDDDDSISEWWRSEQSERENYELAQKLIQEAKKSHEIVFGRVSSDVNRKSFEERFEVELDCLK